MGGDVRMQKAGENPDSLVLATPVCGYCFLLELRLFQGSGSPSGPALPQAVVGGMGLDSGFSHHACSHSLCKTKL